MMVVDSVCDWWYNVLLGLETSGRFDQRCWFGVGGGGGVVVSC